MCQSRPKYSYGTSTGGPSACRTFPNGHYSAPGPTQYRNYDVRRRMKFLNRSRMLLKTSNHLRRTTSTAPERVRGQLSESVVVCRSVPILLPEQVRVLAAECQLGAFSVAECPSPRVCVQQEQRRRDFLCGFVCSRRVDADAAPISAIR